VKTLQGFAKESIESKQSIDIEIKLTPRNFSYWDINTKSWKIRKGSYEILIGSSAATMHLQTKINLEQVQEVLDPLV
jgi:beta-glucosidase